MDINLKFTVKKYALKQKVHIKFFCISLLLLISSIVFAQCYQSELNPAPQWYQGRMATYVLKYCGYGFTEPSEKGKDLKKFLNLESDSFSCDQLSIKETQPKDIVSAMKENEFPISIGSMYLGQIIVWNWQLLGHISWKETQRVGSLLFALTVLFSYWFFRLFFNDWLSFSGSLALMISKLHLENMPHLRDYGKAPFFILSCFFIVKTLRVGCRSYVRYLLSIALGISIGIGYGFRPDIKILIPLVYFLMTFGCFLQIQNENFKIYFIKKIIQGHLLFLVFYAVFILISLPIDFKFKGYPSANKAGLYHVTLLGLTPVTVGELKVNSKDVELLYRYNDNYIAKKLSGFSYQFHNKVPEYLSVAYGSNAKEYLINILAYFPAFFYKRGMLSAVHIARTSLEGGTYVPEKVRKVRGLVEYLSVSKFARFFFRNAYVLFSLLLLFVIIKLRLKEIIIYGIGLGYLLFYPAIQFHPRHYFHLEFIVVLISLFVFHFIWETIMAYYYKRGFYNWRAYIKRVVFVVGILVISWGLLFIYQTLRVDSLIEEKFVRSEKNILKNVISDIENDSLIRLDLEFKNKFEYLVLDISPLAMCQSDSFSLQFYFEESDPYSNDSRTVVSRGYRQIYYPIYTKSFKGVRVNKKKTVCIERISRINLEKEKIPIHLYLFI